MRKTIKKEERNKIIKFNPFDLANIFSIGFNDKKNKYEFLFNKTLYFLHNDDITNTIYDIYEPVEGDTWALISYKTYGTISLWWLILKVNHINNALSEPTDYESLKILNKEFVKNILVQMKES